MNIKPDKNGDWSKKDRAFLAKDVDSYYSTELNIWDSDAEGWLKIADCNRRVILRFDFCMAADRKKLDKLIDMLQTFKREGMEVLEYCQKRKLGEKDE